MKVTADDGSALPFTMRDRTLNFFSGSPGGVKVVAGDREYLYSLTLPRALGIEVDAARRCASRASRASRRFWNRRRDLWPWLALAGALGLLAEWMLYGRFRRGMMRSKPVPMRWCYAECGDDVADRMLQLRACHDGQEAAR